MSKWISLLILLSAFCAFAQEESSSTAVAPSTSVPKKKIKKVKVDFSNNELVEGQAENPEIEFLFQRKQFNYQKMIKLRQDFIDAADTDREMISGTP